MYWAQKATGVSTQGTVQEVTGVSAQPQELTGVSAQPQEMTRVGALGTEGN